MNWVWAALGFGLAVACLIAASRINTDREKARLHAAWKGLLRSLTRCRQ